MEVVPRRLPPVACRYISRADCIPIRPYGLMLKPKVPLLLVLLLPPGAAAAALGMHGSCVLMMVGTGRTQQLAEPTSREPRCSR